MRQTVIDQLKRMGAFNLVTVSRDPNASQSDNPQLLNAGNNDPSGEEGKLIDDNTVALIKHITYVEDATPTLSVWFKTVRLEGQDKKMWSNVLAYDPGSNVFELPIKAGRGLNYTDMDKIVVGSRFVETYGYSSNPQDLIGKKVLLFYQGGGGSAPDWGPPPPQPPINADKYWWESQKFKGVEIPAEIIGVTDNKAGDDSQNYITLAWGKKLMTDVHWEYVNQDGAKDDQGNNIYTPPTMLLVKSEDNKKNGYGSIIIKVADTKNIRSVAETVQKMGYGTTTAENMLAQINKVVSIIGLVLSIIGGISLFVAAIGIINTMIMATYERTREIGVMRACGATKKTIRNLFTIEAGLLGFAGGVLGLVVSLLLINAAKFVISNNLGELSNLPLDNIGHFPPWLIAGVVCFTTGIGMLSGIYPAMRAAKLNPVDALRYE